MSVSNQKRNHVRDLVKAAACLALCLVLPFLTGQIPEIGSALGPMHIPVLLAGFLCGPWWAGIVGLVAPALRHVMFGMPAMPMAIAMCFELATYGLVSGILYAVLPKKTGSIYISLIAAMLAGRIVWGVAHMALTGAIGVPFTWALFIYGAFTSAIPGIILHIVLIPALVLALQKIRIIN